MRISYPYCYGPLQKDVFEVEGTDLGQLTMLVVTVDGAGLRGGWNLDHVLVRGQGGGVGVYT